MKTLVLIARLFLGLVALILLMSEAETFGLQLLSWFISACAFGLQWLLGAFYKRTSGDDRPMWIDQEMR